MALTPFTYLDEEEYKQFKAKQEQPQEGPFAGAKASAAGATIGMPQQITPMDVIGKVGGAALNAGANAMGWAAQNVPGVKGVGDAFGWINQNVEQPVTNAAIGSQMRGQNIIPGPLSYNQELMQAAQKGDVLGGMLAGFKSAAAMPLAPFASAEGLLRTQKQFVDDSGAVPQPGQTYNPPENPLNAAWSKMQQTWNQTPEIPGQKGIAEMLPGMLPVGNVVGPFARLGVQGLDAAITSGKVAQAANVAKRLVPSLGIQRYGPEMDAAAKAIGNVPVDEAAKAYSKGIGLMPENEPIMNLLRRTQDRAIVMAYDKLYPLKRLSPSGYNKARLVRGQVARGEEMGLALDDAFKQVGKGKETDFATFLSLSDDMDQISLTAADKFAGGLVGSQITDQYARLIAKYGYNEVARWRTLSHPIWDASQKVLDELVDAGNLSREMVDAWKVQHPHYMPKLRDEFDHFMPGKKGASAASVDTTGIRMRDAEGSFRNVEDFLTNYKSNLIYGMQAAQRNRAARQIVDDLEAIAQRHGVSGPQVVTGKQPIQRTIDYFENGQKITKTVPEEVGITVNSLLDEPDVGTIGKIFSAIAAPLRYGAVTWNAAFIPRNVSRDLVSAWTREGVGPAGYVGGLFSALRKDQKFAQALDAGVLMSGMVETWKAPTVRRLSQAGLGRGATLVDKATDALLYVPKKIEAINTKFEQAPRIAAYDKLIKKGLTSEQAAVRSRDVTVDFAKSGTLLKTLNIAIPFINANVQGSANMMRSLRDNPTAFALRSTPAVGATLASWANNAQYGDLMNKIPMDLFVGNWIFIWGSHEEVNPRFPDAAPETVPDYILIPKGQYAAIATSPIEYYIRYKTLSKDPLYQIAESNPFAAIASSMAMGMFNAASPIDVSRGGYSTFLPPGLSTGISLLTNQDDYTKRQIVPESLQSYAKENQFTPDTSRMAVGLGQLPGLGPKQWEYLLKDWAGGLGQQALYVGDKALQAVGYNPVAPGQDLQPPKSAEDYWTSAPIVGSFVKNIATSREQTEKETMGKLLTQLRPQWDSANGEIHKKLAVPLGEIGDTVAIDGTETEIPDTMRASYQRDIYTVKMAATDAVINQGWFTKADKETQQKYLKDIHERAIAPLRDSLRGQVQGNAATATADEIAKRMPELAQAYQYYLDYRALPAKLNVSEEDSAYYDAFYTTVQRYVKEYDVSQAKAETAVKKIYRESLGEDEALTYIRAWNKVGNKPENPARKKMRDDKKIGPLLKYWFGI